MTAPETQQHAMKVLVVGDSISHGREGDWTWRYRIWQWCKQQHLDVQFVGPYKGTVPPDEPHRPRPPRLVDEPPDPPPPLRTDGGYAEGVDPEFLANSYHFAASGQQADYAKDLIAEQINIHQPDLCLVELGFNDLGWRWCGPADVLASMKHLIDQARSVKHDLKFAIANIPQRTYMAGREDLPVNTDIYNDMLARSILDWSSSESRIALVRFCESYSCGGSNSDAAYDGLHPNALGEFQLAQAFSRTLVSAFSLGRTPLVIPESIPPRPLPTPTGLKAVPDPCGVVLSWDAVYGALGYDLQRRHAGKNDWTTTHLDGNRYYWQQLRKGEVVECRVRTSGGDSLKSPWTTIASAVADPETIRPPSDITSQAEPTAFHVSWRPPPPPHYADIDRYSVIYFDGDKPGAFPCAVGVRGTAATINGLTPDHRYYIAVETWSSFGPGPPAGARAVRPGKPRPRSPSLVRAEALDSRTVELTWSEVSEAAGYDFWFREAQSSVHGKSVSGDCSKLVPLCHMGSVAHDNANRTLTITLFDMRPSVWDWEYTVTAYNGNIQSIEPIWVSAPPLGSETSLTSDDCIHIELTQR